uniref:Leucine rich repeats and calponin homology domain containing 1 n=1 Tax=Gopherus evgoodei TaxID=1825980 RepID=A0A8C4VYZ1_9SAUR
MRAGPGVAWAGEEGALVSAAACAPRCALPAPCLSRSTAGRARSRSLAAPVHPASRSPAGKMATLGGESQPFPAGLAAAGTLHPQQLGGGAGSLGYNLPLSRALERALEEAAHSGGLSLSARKLKEFPRGAPRHDLSDTVRADLSKNRLTEVPMELCHFVSLETLNLYHNCIKIIPDAIVNLQMLTYLNLSRNQLSSLPACLCGLPLKVLIASNNRLGSLPEEIGQLKQLMELDVSCNEITALPQQIGQLKSLRELNIRRNYLKVLPQELIELPLVKFDFSCNKVLVIPICFRKMLQLQVLLLENNPLQSPPAQICIKGKVHIFKYLSIQACQIKTADSLYLNAIERPHLQQPVEESIDDIYPSKKDSDSGVGSDNGDKRLSATEVTYLNFCFFSHFGLYFQLDSFVEILSVYQKYAAKPWTEISTKVKSEMMRIEEKLYSIYPVEGDVKTLISKYFLRPQRKLESIDPQFTIRGTWKQMRERERLVEQLRENIEMRLKICLPEDLGSALMDGVVLCHLVNHIRPRSVGSIHVPSPAVPKLSMAKCRRNVENFLDACRKLGIPEEKLCLPHHILEEKGLVKVSITVQALLDVTTMKQALFT